MQEPNLETMLKQVDPQRIRATVEKLASWNTRNTNTPECRQAAEWLAEEYRKIPGLQVELFKYQVRKGSRIPEDREVVQVVATLPGRTDRRVLVGGHMDTINMAQGADLFTARSPGANDDASGTAMALELARIMSRRKWENTLMFVAFTGEEQGLLGSGALALHAREQNWNLEAVLSNDMIGNVQNKAGLKNNKVVRVFSEEYVAPARGRSGSGGVEAERSTIAPGTPTLQPPPPLASLQGEGEKQGPAVLQEKGEMSELARSSLQGESATRAQAEPRPHNSRELARWIEWNTRQHIKGHSVKLVFRRDRFGRGGDHTPFVAQGFTAVRVVEVHEEYDHQHTIMDLPEFIDWNYLANNARVNLAAMAMLADAGVAPTNVRMVRNEGHHTRVTWRGTPGVKYVVYWRDTASPVWEKCVEVGAVDRFVVEKVNVDDHQFAVGAVGGIPIEAR